MELSMWLSDMQDLKLQLARGEAEDSVCADGEL